MMKVVLAAAALCVIAAGPALALPCAPEAEQEAAKLTAKLVKETVEPITPVEGKQMLNVSSCERAGPLTLVEFRFNYMSGGAYYWLEGQGEFKAGDGAITARRLSDNLKAANQTKNGTLLASR